MGLKHHVNIGIMGYGEVGKAIHSLYKEKPFNVLISDLKTQKTFDSIVTILNVCIPYSKDFISDVSDAIVKYKPTLVIIHSTTLPGTTRQIQALHKYVYVVHSPIRGNHSHLNESLLNFIKYIGSDTYKGYKIANIHLQFLGLQTKKIKDSFSSELAKVLCTTYYGLCIAWHGLADNLCKMYDLDFQEVVTDWNITYNDGYQKMNTFQYTRPVL